MSGLFVSYAHSGGFGCITLSECAEPETFDDVLALIRRIEQAPPQEARNVIILFWKPLRTAGSNPPVRRLKPVPTTLENRDA